MTSRGLLKASADLPVAFATQTGGTHCDATIKDEHRKQSLRPTTQIPLVPCLPCGHTAQAGPFFKGGGSLSPLFGERGVRGDLEGGFVTARRTTEVIKRSSLAFTPHHLNPPRSPFFKLTMFHICHWTQGKIFVNLTV